jgi:hypothetical protein
MFGKAAVSAKIEAVAAVLKHDYFFNEIRLDAYRIFSRYFTVNVWG